MKTFPYTPSHMLERTERVKKIWIKEFMRERQNKFITVIPTITAYSIGFWSGSLGHGISFWLVTVIISVVMWRIFKFLRVTYKINI